MRSAIALGHGHGSDRQYCNVYTPAAAAHLSRCRGEAIAGRVSMYRGSHALPHVEVKQGIVVEAGSRVVTLVSERLWPVAVVHRFQRVRQIIVQHDNTQTDVKCQSASCLIKCQGLSAFNVNIIVIRHRTAHPSRPLVQHAVERSGFALALLPLSISPIFPCPRYHGSPGISPVSSPLCGDSLTRGDLW